MSSNVLPKADDPNVFLAVANVDELREQWKSNSVEWQGPFTLETYLRREELLISQDLTKNAGLVPWILAHQPDETGPRRILCGCETITKRALVARDGEVKDVLCNGVASVFCSSSLRGQGYAGRMMSELAKRLESWEFPRQSQDPERVLFSVLYSDIGKRFYAQRGWQNFSSAHISLSSRAAPSSSEVRLLHASDIPALAAADEALLRTRLQQLDNNRTVVAVVPEARTIRWLQARAEFFAQELFQKTVVNLGAVVDIAPRRRVWCYWQHNWSKVEKDKDNKLYVLRIVVEDDAGADFSAASEDSIAQQPADVVKAVSVLLEAAQAEAAAWELSSVEVWNPTSLQLAAARLIDHDVSVQHRDISSIAALQWYGEGSWEEVDWVCNERYGWN